jgi:hypothetical protein
MKKITLLALFVLAGLIATANYTYPVEKPEAYQMATGLITPSSSSYTFISNLKIKEVEKLLGRKMKLKEKLAFKLYQWKLKKELKKKADETDNKGETAFILGIVLYSSLMRVLRLFHVPYWPLFLATRQKRIIPTIKKLRQAHYLAGLHLGYL